VLSMCSSPKSILSLTKRHPPLWTASGSLGRVDGDAWPFGARNFRREHVKSVSVRTMDSADVSFSVESHDCWAFVSLPES